VSSQISGTGQSPSLQIVIIGSSARAGLVRWFVIPTGVEESLTLNSERCLDFARHDNFLRVAHASRVLAMTSRHRRLF